MELPDPWTIHRDTGAPSKEECRREMREEEPEVVNPCPLCGRSLDDAPYMFDGMDNRVHVRCLREVKEAQKEILSKLKSVNTHELGSTSKSQQLRSFSDTSVSAEADEPKKAKSEPVTASSGRDKGEKKK